MCFAPQHRALFWTTEGQKVARTRQSFTLLTWKCASRHNIVHSFDIWTSESGPNTSVFYTFDLEMCFAHLRATTACIFSTSERQKVVLGYGALYILTWKCASRQQQRALLRHLNVKKWSEPVNFLRFWLGNVLSCTFSTSEHQKVVRGYGALYILTWKCASPRNAVHFLDIWTLKRARPRQFFALLIPSASRHNSVHFFDIATCKSGPGLWCFVHFDLEMCFAPQRRATFHLSSGQMAPPAALASLLFDPPEPQIIRKTRWIATFLPFRVPASSFFSLFLFSDLLTSSLLLSDSSHLCFSICPYCRKFDF